MVPRWLVMSAVLGMPLIGAGCGGGSGPSTSSTVYGVVTLDGQSLAEGTVNFASPATGNAAIATVNDGKFVVTGGMVPGDYKIVVTPPTPTPDNPMPKESKIPEKYRSPETTDLTEKIKGGRNEVKLELKS